MGRRSQHTPDELKELILTATRRVIEDEGISQPSAREIARAIGYAPGTLYNMFHNLDEILLQVEARIFGELEQRIYAATSGHTGSDAIRQFVDAYVGFAFENSKLWSLIVQHHPTSTAVSPDWYLERVYAPLNHLEKLLSKLNPSDDTEEVSRWAQLIWSSLHGAIQVAMTAKFGMASRPKISKMAQEQVDLLLTGLSQHRRPDIRRSTANGTRAAGPAE